MRTIRTTRLGKIELRLVETGKTFVALAFADGVKKLERTGNTADEAWTRLHNDLGQTNPKYVGFTGARNRFLHFFPNGFRSIGYSAEERDYKVAAKEKLDLNVSLTQAVDGSGFGEDVLAVFRATNLLSPFEKIRVQNLLRGPSADSFVRAVARFTTAPSQSILLDMERVLKPHDAAKWSIVSYLPFLWRPQTHMFLKPEVTKDFASCVGHRFASDYEPRLKLEVYESLVDLARVTEDELAELEPLDRIDVQSFIWVVGDYDQEREQPKP